MYGVKQVTGPMPSQFTGQQVAGPAAYYPRESAFGGMFEMMMPMIMMIMMMAIVMPMLKGIMPRD